MLLSSAKSVRDNRISPDRTSPPSAPYARHTIRDLSPRLLGIHRAVLPAGDIEPTDLPELTKYLTRVHDHRLRAVISSVKDGGSAAFALLTGESTTGKTRAMYEAVAALAGDWPLIRPEDAEDLLRLLTKSTIQPRTVLWLNETQRFLYGPSGQRVARLLISLLDRASEVLVIGSMWEHPYLSEFLARGRFPDGHASVRDLLEGPATARIPVPPNFEPEQLGRLASDDPRLEAAAQASGEDGRLTQRLTGANELLDAYLHGGLFSPVEHALITAALDARRLGHHRPLPAVLLEAAADGYLTDRQRPGDPDWAVTALNNITSGVRTDGSRTDIRRTLTALTALRQRSGDLGAYYEPEDFLVQFALTGRWQVEPPRTLLEVLVRHADPQSARTVGFYLQGIDYYRDAARAFQRAVMTLGDAYSGSGLVEIIHQVDPASTADVSRWVVEQVSGGEGIGTLLETLKDTGADDARSTLLAHAAVIAADVDTWSSVSVLRALADEDHEAAEAFALRAPAAMTFDHPDTLWPFLTALTETRCASAAAALAARPDLVTFCEQVTLDDPEPLGFLLDGLYEAHAHEAVAALIVRDPGAHCRLTDASGVALLIQSLWYCAGPDVAFEWSGRFDPSAEVPEELAHIGALRTLHNLLARNPALEVDLEVGEGVGFLLEALHGIGADRAISQLLDRDLPYRVPFVAREPLGCYGFAHLLRAIEPLAAPPYWVLSSAPEGFNSFRDLDLLPETPFRTTFIRMVDRLAHAPTDDDWQVILLLDVLEAGDARDAIEDLCRCTAAEIPLTEPLIDSLLDKLRRLGQDAAADVLEQRLTEANLVRTPLGGFRHLSNIGDANIARLTFGLSADGRPADHWGWADICGHRSDTTPWPQP
ncbi:hypothetical protein [Acrocarpospora macrocephala]|uniref:hypothetical protein n=1 Tax=Acrocarpospora macrocephala TaxID=150177 RepID=UPI0012D2BE07|nr:hypothetical protein [Acrocarpospora macrocephala]